MNVNWNYQEGWVGELRVGFKPKTIIGVGMVVFSETVQCM